MTRNREGSRGASQAWDVRDARDLYGIDGWGRGFVDVGSNGRLLVGPDDATHAPIDLKALVEEVAERGIELPLLIRFSDILKARLREVYQAFARAIEENEYSGTYRGVYPIKVNQDRYVVEALLDSGRDHHYGLEAGSKPELLAVLAMLEDPEAIVICNGYKDESYIETALLGSRLGLEIVLVVEKPAELEMIARVSERLGVRPSIGVRARLTTRGAGHWKASGGDRSKFGLGARDLIEAVDFLKEHNLLDCFSLLHFHLGSQISAIGNVKDALREAAWLYVNLSKMGVPLKYLDVGGGLGIDYDGSRTDQLSSVNYSLQEYANDVVYGVQQICTEHDVAPPTLITEAGRATVAHHAVLVVEVLGVGEFEPRSIPQSPPEGAPTPLSNLCQALSELTAENAREYYHDAIQYRSECHSLFTLGILDLRNRVLAEDAFWATCYRVRELMSDAEPPFDELDTMDKALADTYFCNFSVFQSLPDSWAIDQLFPILPIDRLDERPTHSAVIADITCDSDGKIDRFIDPAETRSALELHTVDRDPYYLGIFLVGAYQEILGDLHNLFGDTNTVIVSADESGYSIDHVVQGNTVQEVLAYVGYDRSDLMARIRRGAERSIRSGRINRQEARELVELYRRGLDSYTYLD